MGAYMAKGKCLLLFLFFFLSVGAANAQFPPSGAGVDLQDWDEDGNTKLTHAEFYNGLRQKELFEHWNRKADGKLVRQEFFSGKEGLLKNQESILTAEAGLVDSNSPGPFVPGSAHLPQGEIYRELPIFSFEEADLNRNGALDQTEFITALFRLWDKNNDGHINEAELKGSQLWQWFY